MKTFIYNCLRLTVATAYTGISKVSWIVVNKIQEKSPSASTTIIFENPKVTKKFPIAHRAAWSDVISLIPMTDTKPNPIIQSMHVRILRDPHQSGMYPGSKKLEIPHKMGYLTQSYESTVVPHEKIILKIDNVPTY